MTMQSQSKRIWVPTCQPRRIRLAEEPRATITCRACQAHEEVGLDNELLLCGRCRSDPYEALERLTVQTAAAEAQICAAGARFQASLAAAHPRDRDRYARVVVTLADALSLQQDTPRLERVLRAVARASSADDGLAALLAAEAQLREMVQWLQKTYRQVRIASEECLLAIDSQPAE